MILGYILYVILFSCCYDFRFYMRLDITVIQVTLALIYKSLAMNSLMFDLRNNYFGFSTAILWIFMWFSFL